MEQDASTYKDDSPENSREKDTRAAWAVGFSRAAEISNVGLQFVLPTLFGWWCDQKLNTPFIGLGIGLAVGMFLAIISLLHIVRRPIKK